MISERETETSCKIVCKCEAFVFQEELLTDLEAHLEEDDDQGTCMSLSSTIQFVQSLSFLLSCQEQYVRYTWMIGLQLVNL